MERIINICQFRKSAYVSDRSQRFVYALQRCGKFLMTASDEIIETCIFVDIQSVRTSKVWREVLELSDEIKSLLYY